VYQGSSRIGSVIIPELVVEDADKNPLTKFGVQSIMKIVVLASLLLVGQGKKKYVYAGVLALLIAGLGYWYQAQAQVFESTDYRQFRYTVSVNPAADDKFWISCGAIDTYTSAPP